MKSIRVTEEKLFEIKIYISEKLEYEDYDSDVQREIRADAGLDDDYHYDDGEYYNGDEDDYDDFYEEDEYGYWFFIFLLYLIFAGYFLLFCFGAKINSSKIEKFVKSFIIL